MDASATMPSELHANRGGSVSHFAVSTLTFRMAEQRRQPKTYPKVLASSFSTHKQGGPMPFILHFGRMLCGAQWRFTTPFQSLTAGYREWNSSAQSKWGSNFKTYMCLERPSLLYPTSWDRGVHYQSGAHDADWGYTGTICWALPNCLPGFEFYNSTGKPTI